jgi:hypothetical protein
MNARINPNDLPENQYAIGRKMKVRKLVGVYEIVDSRMIGKKRRYTLKPVLGTGCALNETEAYGDAMQPAPEPEPAPVLSLAPATAAQEHAAPDGQPVPAPAAERSTADAIRSPAERITLSADDGLEPGAFGGELDEYSIGARFPNEPGELKNPFKPVRKFPENPAYRDLKCIVYNARFKGMEKWDTSQIEQLPDGTPIAVAVTHETNGHSIWIIVTDTTDDTQRARLEVFYPHAHGSSADAIEYAVLLALRQVPISTEDLEILLLELSN